MRPRDLVELVRAPAALTVPGDSLAGAAAAGWPHAGRTAALPVASACFYWAGMALNDYADRALDAVERPERPIPSGRVAPRHALGVAAGLTGAGLAAAAMTGGRYSMRTGVLLSAAVWGYDLVAKKTAAGPLVMAAARVLDVALGRGAAFVGAGAVAHTTGVTALSRGEVHGTSSRMAQGAIAGTTAAALLAATPRQGQRAAERLTTCVLAGTYLVTVGGAQLAAVDDPRASTVNRATSSGVRGVIPLQAALTARSTAPGAAVLGIGLLGLGPLARWASRLVSPT